MKKLFFDKNDDLAAIVERVITDESDDELILVIPKGSLLKSSLLNFQILKREAESAGKEVVVESVDAEVLALAEKASLTSTHPLFREGARGVSDIHRKGAEEQPATEEEDIEDEREAAQALADKKERESAVTKVRRFFGTGQPKITAEPILTTKRTAEREDEAKEDTKDVPFDKAVFEEKLDKKRKPEVKAKSEPELVPEEEGETEEAALVKEEKLPEKVSPLAMGRSGEGGRKWVREEPARRPRFRVRSTIALVAILIFAVAAVLIADRVFGKASVVVTFKETPWQYSSSMTASKSVTRASAVSNALAAEVVSQQKNIAQFFPASGKSNVSQKATGKLTIYNAYSSQPQSLVATTRFITADGKIYRLDSDVTVPGAEVKDGNIIPSSIETTVTANTAGTDGNIGPTEKLAIPGFQGSPKYKGFYGSLREGATGGFVGEHATPTEADIVSAREQITNLLKESLKSNVVNNRPEDFKIIDGASDVTITRLTVNKNTNEEGKFSVSGEAKFRAIAFRESDLKAFLLAMANKDRPNLIFKKLELTYASAKPDFEAGTLSFAASAAGVLGPDFQAEEFLGQIVGQNLNHARSLIEGLPELSEGRISVYPVWLGSIPTNRDRVKIEVK